MKICEIIGFAVSLSVQEVVAEARSDPSEAGRAAAAVPRCPHYPHPGRAERWARIPCHDTPIIMTND